MNKLKKYIWEFFRILILTGTGFIIMYPIIYMISCAFRDSADMNDPSVMWIPKHLTLDVMKDTIKAMDFGNALKNTLFLNVGCAVVQVISCAVTGYGFARFDFIGKKFLFGIVIMMILVPSQVISLPLYIQFMNFGIGNLKINLIDNILTMYLPAMSANGLKSGLMILIFRQFFSGFPKELEESAYIDGCSPFRTFISVIMPNALPAVLTVFLLSVVIYWNDFYTSSAFFRNTKTLGLVLENLDNELKMHLFGETAQISPREQIVWQEAGCLLVLSPLLIMYVFLQKHFTEGIERSGLIM
ncbi:MAG: carbohydrate ABC transporter permease [Prevotella sp.]|nr:carbohydrate ABC transporter permease [Alistipes senegalensis]MCM1358482.1 carbohydrate ABC transporter permease [Prevotella sp.]MCM1473054.1 carbohydrate ABC transporter permease [Muribaculaceae bacterium]